MRTLLRNDDGGLLLNSSGKALVKSDNCCFCHTDWDALWDGKSWNVTAVKSYCSPCPKQKSWIKDTACDCHYTCTTDDGTTCPTEGSCPTPVLLPPDPLVDPIPSDCGICYFYWHAVFDGTKWTKQMTFSWWSYCDSYAYDWVQATNDCYASCITAVPSSGPAPCTTPTEGQPGYPADPSWSPVSDCTKNCVFYWSATRKGTQWVIANTGSTTCVAHATPTPWTVSTNPCVYTCTTCVATGCANASTCTVPTVGQTGYPSNPTIDPTGTQTCHAHWEAVWNGSWTVNFLDAICQPCPADASVWTVDPATVCRYTCYTNSGTCTNDGDCTTGLTPPSPPGFNPVCGSSCQFRGEYVVSGKLTICNAPDSVILSVQDGCSWGSSGDLDGVLSWDGTNSEWVYYRNVNTTCGGVRYGGLGVAGSTNAGDPTGLYDRYPISRHGTDQGGIPPGTAIFVAAVP